MGCMNRFCLLQTFAVYSPLPMHVWRADDAKTQYEPRSLILEGTEMKKTGNYYSNKPFLVRESSLRFPHMSRTSGKVITFQYVPVLV